MVMRSISETLLIKVLGFSFVFCLISIYPTAASSQQLFETYGMVSLSEERARLDNFAFSLERDSDYLGYIVVQASKKDMRAAMNRALRARNYLIRKRKIVRQRIIIARWNREMENVEFILQPVPPNAQVPKEWKRFR